MHPKRKKQRRKRKQKRTRNKFNCHIDHFYSPSFYTLSFSITFHTVFNKSCFSFFFSVDFRPVVLVKGYSVCVSERAIIVHTLSLGPCELRLTVHTTPFLEFAIQIQIWVNASTIFYWFWAIITFHLFFSLLFPFYHSFYHLFFFY